MSETIDVKPVVGDTCVLNPAGVDVKPQMMAVVKEEVIEQVNHVEQEGLSALHLLSDAADAVSKSEITATILQSDIPDGGTCSTTQPNGTAGKAKKPAKVRVRKSVGKKKTESSISSTTTKKTSGKKRVAKVKSQDASTSKQVCVAKEDNRKKSSSDSSGKKIKKSSNRNNLSKACVPAKAKEVKQSTAKKQESGKVTKKKAKTKAPKATTSPPSDPLVLPPRRGSVDSCDSSVKDAAAAVGAATNERRRERLVCGECNKQLSTPVTLRRHFAAMHHSTPFFRCRVCRASFFQRRDFRKHEAGHQRCGVCAHRVADRVALFAHMSSHAEQLPFMCAYCAACFRLAAQLRAHVAALHRLQPSLHVCGKCDAAHESGAALERHVAAAHPPSRVALEGATYGANMARVVGLDTIEHLPYKCGKCSRGFLRGDTLRGHIAGFHRITCPSERRLHFVTMSYRKRRLQRAGGAPSSGDPDARGKGKRKLAEMDPETGQRKRGRKKKVKLDGGTEDGRVAAAKEVSAKSQHRRTSHAARTTPRSGRSSGGASYRCRKCGRTFVARRRLYVHVLGHREQRRRASHCGVCRRAFRRALHLHRHFQLHADAQPYKCEACTAVLTDIWQLTDHMAAAHFPASAASAQTHACATCAKRFFNRHSLQRHALNHKAGRNYECDVCRMSFSTARARHVHGFVHEPKHICGQCGEGFGYLSILRWHAALRHECSTVCRDCGAAFSSLAQFRRHRYAAHVRTRQHECAACRTCCYSRSALAIHRATTCAATAKNCENCGRACRSVALFAVHSRWCRRRPLEATPTGSAKPQEASGCQIADLASSAFAAKDEHTEMVIVAGTDPETSRNEQKPPPGRNRWPITQVSRSIQKESGLVVYKQFVCKLCANKYSSQSGAVRHIKNIHGDAVQHLIDSRPARDPARKVEPPADKSAQEGPKPCIAPAGKERKPAEGERKPAEGERKPAEEERKPAAAESERQPFVCALCGKDFVTDADRESHCRVAHKTKLTSHGGVDGAAVEGHSSATKLSSAGHPLKIPPKVVGSHYECRPCNERFFSVTELRDHLKTARPHQHEDAAKCRVCGKKFLSPSIRNHHISVSSCWRTTTVVESVASKVEAGAAAVSPSSTSKAATRKAEPAAATVVSSPNKSVVSRLEPGVATKVPSAIKSLSSKVESGSTMNVTPASKSVASKVEPYTALRVASMSKSVASKVEPDTASKVPATSKSLASKVEPHTTLEVPSTNIPVVIKVEHHTALVASTDKAVAINVDPIRAMKVPSTNKLVARRRACALPAEVQKVENHVNSNVNDAPPDSDARVLRRARVKVKSPPAPHGKRTRASVQAQKQHKLCAEGDDSSAGTADHYLLGGSKQRNSSANLHGEQSNFTHDNSLKSKPVQEYPSGNDCKQDASARDTSDEQKQNSTSKHPCESQCNNSQPATVRQRRGRSRKLNQKSDFPPKKNFPSRRKPATTSRKVVIVPDAEVCDDNAGFHGNDSVVSLVVNSLVNQVLLELGELEEKAAVVQKLDEDYQGRECDSVQAAASSAEPSQLRKSRRVVRKPYDEAFVYSSEVKQFWTLDGKPTDTKKPSTDSGGFQFTVDSSMKHIAGKCSEEVVVQAASGVKSVPGRKRGRRKKCSDSNTSCDLQSAPVETDLNQDLESAKSGRKPRRRRTDNKPAYTKKLRSRSTGSAANEKKCPGEKRKRQRASKPFASRQQLLADRKRKLRSDKKSDVGNKTASEERPKVQPKTETNVSSKGSAKAPRKRRGRGNTSDEASTCGEAEFVTKSRRAHASKPEGGAAAMTRDGKSRTQAGKMTRKSVDELITKDVVTSKRVRREIKKPKLSKDFVYDDSFVALSSSDMQQNSSAAETPTSQASDSVERITITAIVHAAQGPTDMSPPASRSGRMIRPKRWDNDDFVSDKTMSQHMLAIISGEATKSNSAHLVSGDESPSAIDDAKQNKLSPLKLKLTLKTDGSSKIPMYQVEGRHDELMGEELAPLTPDLDNEGELIIDIDAWGQELDKLEREEARLVAFRKDDQRDAFSSDDRQSEATSSDKPAYVSLEHDYAGPRRSAGDADAASTRRPPEGALAADGGGAAARFRCSRCFRKFTDHRRYRKHAKLHFRRPNLECDLCAAEFLSRRELKAHRRTHKEPAWRCHECTRVFASLRKLKRHLREDVHAKSRRVALETASDDERAAPLSFPSTADQAVATIVPGGDKANICTICGAAYVTLKALQGHMDSHADQAIASILPDGMATS
ncbi:PREDICTED: uncharacterized protein LOC106821253 [Priapulus caudatus]|uniref:Uncharacterized protein LOC106821253 n=1 Tax=Priapulus caudatus TaxID=37621 RepID=A0ABM1FAJ1_PRICU|nr:PREDICTED: uncharacterized protein LOC106821253 [Priapulus caudatus]